MVLTLFRLQKTRKNLPAIKIIPEAVGSLFLNVLNNAFQAVIENKTKESKGYQKSYCKHTHSSRFLQIRVKDNGDGMNDADLTRSTEEYVSMKAPNKVSD